ncbi:MAG: shikimate dehydrogenase, partial [Candidatus Neomarinimicrobiota bacterium]
MKKFAVIGDPIEHSQSPDLHNWVFQQQKVNAEYVKLRIATGAAEEFLAGMRGGAFDGINVTLPLKELVAARMDFLEAQAVRLQAVNCVHRQHGKLTGYNTDIIGFGNTLAAFNVRVAGQVCILLGAGGVARSVLAALLEQNPARIIIVNRTSERARRLSRWGSGLDPAIE